MIFHTQFGEIIHGHKIQVAFMFGKLSIFVPIHCEIKSLLLKILSVNVRLFDVAKHVLCLSGFRGGWLFGGNTLLS